jgi:hypothetical protein
MLALACLFVFFAFGLAIALYSRPLPKELSPRWVRAIALSVVLNVTLLILWRMNPYWIYLAFLCNFVVGILVAVIAGRWPLVTGVLLGPWLLPCLLAYKWKEQPVSFRWVDTLSVLAMSFGSAFVGATIVAIVWSIKRSQGLERSVSPRERNSDRSMTVQVSIRAVLGFTLCIGLMLAYHVGFERPKQRLVEEVTKRGGSVAFHNADFQTKTTWSRFRRSLSEVVSPLLGSNYFLQPSSLTIAGNWQSEDTAIFKGASSVREVNFNLYGVESPAWNGTLRFEQARVLRFQHRDTHQGIRPRTPRATLEVWPSLSKDFPQVQHVSMWLCEIQPDSLDRLLAIPSLTSIVFHDCRVFADATATSLSEDSSRQDQPRDAKGDSLSPTLQSVQVDYSGDAMILLNQIAKRAPHVRSVTVSNCSLTDDDALWICQTFRPRFLHIEGGSLTENLIPRLGDSVVDLESLHLQIYPLSEASTLLLPPMPRLKNLSLTGLRVTSAVKVKLKTYPQLPQRFPVEQGP